MNGRAGRGSVARETKGAESFRGARRARQSGQTLVLAVLAMFALTFLGGLFIALLARNMTRTQRHANTLSAQYFAEAGIRYADSQLTYGPDGADWRPRPENEGYDGVQVDPDFRWLRPYAAQETGAEIPGTGGLHERGPSGGYTRIQQQNGRYLIRVTYNPSNTVSNSYPLAPDWRSAKPADVRMAVGQSYGVSPLSKYIIIESVGREGVFDPNDPTTFQQTNLRRELMALKPIAITDYLRFVTNKANEGLTATLGVTPFMTDDGRRFASADPSGTPPPGHAQNLGAYYGPIRVNGDLKWKGMPKVYLNVGYENGGAGGVVRYTGEGAAQGLRGDAVEVAGDVSYADSATEARLVSGATTGEGLQAYPSTSGLYQTYKGAYRDGRSITDAQGYPRGVTRLEPPNLDAEDPGTGLSRWRLLTRNSQPNLPLTGTYAEQAAAAGLGSGIYINNPKERQIETSAFTLKDDWLQPGNTISSNWRGHQYRPPGVQILLIPGPLKLPVGALLDGQTITQSEAKDKDAWGSPALTLVNGAIRITRSDSRWYDLNGKDSNQYTEYFQYPLAPGEDLRVPKRAPTLQNGVIFAEGNVRIRGRLPMDRLARILESGVARQELVGTGLTVVSGGTIYVEGSLRKGLPNDQPSADKIQRSSLALLARDYVAVNATAYFVGPDDTYSGDWNGVYPTWHTALYMAPHDRYNMYLMNTEDALGYPKDSDSDFRTAPTQQTISGVTQSLLVQHTAESYPGTQAALYVNGQESQAWNQLSLNLVKNSWAHNTVPLTASGLSSLWNSTGTVENWLQLRYQPGRPDASPYWLAKAAIVPLDVRIEAAMYAMNGSFFVIPGVPFNADVPQDTRAYRARMDHRAPEIAPDLPQDIRDKMPYPYFGEPLDIKVTIYGAIAENKPAGEQADEATYRRWGWTPLSKPSGALTAHGGDGLSLLYDPMLRSSLRFDTYGRPLPLAPRLPTSPDLVYFGESSQ